jgi:hypothetical protein
MLPVYLCVCVTMYPPISFWMSKLIFMKLGVHLNDLLHRSPSSVCVSACTSHVSLLGKGSVKCIPLFVARQRLCKHVPAATNTRNDRRIVELVCLSLCPRISLSLIGNSVKTFPRQRRIVGGVVFYAACVVSKESRLLVLPRTSCLCITLHIIITIITFS